jgi:hypothetical protein
VYYYYRFGVTACFQFNYLLCAFQSSALFLIASVVGVKCRSVGTFGMVLQQLVDSGQLAVTDYLLDDNNVVLKVRSDTVAHNEAALSAIGA